MNYQLGRQTWKIARGQSLGVMAVVVLSILYVVPSVYADHVQQEPSFGEAQSCAGDYAGRSVSREVLQAILVDHGKWQAGQFMRRGIVRS